MDEGYGNDVQIVVDRMSEAIQAMSGRSQRRDRKDSSSVLKGPGATSASPRLIGHSVAPSRSTETQHSSTASPRSASTDFTRPPATISSPMNTGARKCADESPDAIGSTRPSRHEGREMTHREHPVRDDPGEPSCSRDGFVLMQRVLVSPGVRVGLHRLGRDDT